LTINQHYISTDQYLSRKYPTIGFIHANPGLVDTAIARDLPWYAKYPSRALLKLGSSPEVVGERLFFAGYSSPDFAKGGHIVDGSLKDVSKRANDKNYLREEMQELIWSHVQGLYQDVLSCNYTEERSKKM
jgi:hypothetical protein